MTLPIILTVDDETAVLNAIERDLLAHYHGHYRILKATSGAAALRAVKQLTRRDETVALFLVDQRMAGQSGIEFLREAAEFYPLARKVLLTAYADTEVAIASINDIGLDYYLMKPWDPPEDNLYPVLDDLLSDWQAASPPPYDGLRVAGTLWSAQSHETKDFLSRNRIPYHWLDIERDAEAQRLMASIDNPEQLLPVVFFPGGEALIAPEPRALAEKVGLQTEATATTYDLIIIGGGPAGLGAAVYGASEGYQTLLIDKEATGGQAGTSSKIENYLGFPSGISGADLARRATTQAMRLGAEVLTAQEVVGMRVEDPYRFVILEDGSELAAKAIIIASGVTVRPLDAPGVAELAGRGVYYGAAMTEAAAYRGEHVYVVGGANSAGQAAMFFSRYASRVTMLVRGSSLSKGMSNYLVKQIEHTPLIEVQTRHSVVQAHGTQRLEAITIQNNDSGETWRETAPALFIFIGAEPHTVMVAGVVTRNRAGFILTGVDLLEDGRPPKDWPLRRDPYLLETSVPGIFAAGDVRQGAVRRVASAVGQGANAINFVAQYLRTV